MTAAAVLPIEQQALSPVEKQALSTAERACGIVVSTVIERVEAAEIGRVVAGLFKEAEEFFRPMKQAAAKAHKEICNKENSILQPLENAKQYLSRQIGAFDARVEQERRVEEARRQEEARKQAEADADRLSQEQAIADAVELEAAGDTAGAEAVLNHPAPVAVFVPAVIVRREVPKTEGVSVSQNWKFRITNEALIPREYMMPNEKLLGQLARATKDKTNIPGIEVYPEGGARFRA